MLCYYVLYFCAINIKSEVLLTLGALINLKKLIIVGKSFLIMPGDVR